MADTSAPSHPSVAATNAEAARDFTLDEIRSSLRNLRYGSVTIIVQDGVIIQIDRTEKRRLQPRRANQRGTTSS